MPTKPKRKTRPAGTLQPLAAALGITTRRVTSLLKAGMPDSVPEALQWRAARETSDSSTGALRRERILLVRAQRQRLETESAVRAGELISCAEVRQSVYRVCRACRDEFLKLPHDLPPRLEGLPASQIAKVLRAEIVEILTRLSDESANSFGNPAG
jgi:phage terminase Nu1 subunit (DNA packaging protein)